MCVSNVGYSVFLNVKQNIDPLVMPQTVGNKCFQKCVTKPESSLSGS
jgi:hypothetical protein